MIAKKREKYPRSETGSIRKTAAPLCVRRHTDASYDSGYHRHHFDS